jgi:hypothetical protein
MSHSQIASANPDDPFRPEPSDALNEALRHAASAKDLAKLAELIAQGADPKSADSSGLTALIRAANAASVECVRLLLPLSDPMAQDRSGGVALGHAAASGSVECVELLLPASDPNHQNKAGETALHFAVETRSPRLVSYLATKCDWTIEDNSGRTALALAAACKGTECLRALLPHVDVNRPDSGGSLAVEWAISFFDRQAETEELERVALLMDVSDLSFPDQNGWDLLGRTILGSKHDKRHWISASLMRLFLERVDTRKPFKKSGLTHLMVAGGGGLDEAAHELLLAASDPLAVQRDGQCALTHAQSPDGVRFLTRHPAYQTVEGQARLLAALAGSCGGKDAGILSAMAEPLKIGLWGREAGCALMKILQEHNMAELADTLLAQAEDDVFDDLREAYLRGLMPLSNRRAEARAIARAARDGAWSRSESGEKAPEKRKPRAL